jgi:hypothetical protein
LKLVEISFIIGARVNIHDFVPIVHKVVPKTGIVWFVQSFRDFTTFAFAVRCCLDGNVGCAIRESDRKLKNGENSPDTEGCRCLENLLKSAPDEA